MEVNTKWEKQLALTSSPSDTALLVFILQEMGTDVPQRAEEHWGIQINGL